MRDREEVVGRFVELRERYLKERKEQFLSRLPINCVFNVRLRVKGKGQIGLCSNPILKEKCGNKMLVCNDASTCERCKLFTCKNTDESVEASFEEILKSPARVGNDYPKLAVLIWFLQDYVLPSRKSRFWQTLKGIVVSLWNLLTFRWW